MRRRRSSTAKRDAGSVIGVPCLRSGMADRPARTGQPRPSVAPGQPTSPPRRSPVRVAPSADLVMANHVVYFWRDPGAELAHIHGVLRPGGLLALGYQLKQNMPAMARRRFPPAGHRLYEADDELLRRLFGGHPRWMRPIPPVASTVT